MRIHRFEGVEEEIRREKAETLGRVGERLDRALREIETLRRELRDLASCGTVGDPRINERVPEEIQEKFARYDRLCSQASHFRYALIIQREALGLRRHEDVDRQYPMPTRMTLPRITQAGDIP